MSNNEINHGIPTLEPDTPEQNAAKMAYVMRYGLQAPFTGNMLSSEGGNAYTVVIIPTYAIC